MINLRKGESDIKGHRAEFSNGLAVLWIPLIWGRNEPQLSPVFFCILYSVFSILYCRPLAVAVTMINLSIWIESPPLTFFSFLRHLWRAHTSYLTELTCKSLKMYWQIVNLWISLDTALTVDCHKYNPTTRTLQPGMAKDVVELSVTRVVWKQYYT